MASFWKVASRSVARQNELLRVGSWRDLNPAGYRFSVQMINFAALTMGTFFLVACSHRAACPSCPKQLPNPVESQDCFGERTAEQAVKVEQKSPASDSAFPADEKLARLVSFDCTSSFEHKQGEGLRTWNNGGPAGAAWNWYGSDLICTVSLLAVREARIIPRLRVGQSYRSEQVVLLQPHKIQEVSFTVTSKNWEQALGKHEEEPFKTCLFIIEVQVERAPDYPFFLSDSFVAGFSGGE